MIELPAEWYRYKIPLSRLMNRAKIQRVSNFPLHCRRYLEFLPSQHPDGELLRR